ncbi:MAG: V-type ATP synthase subunit D [Candidatus Bathyarchaeia archaeon]
MSNLFGQRVRANRFELLSLRKRLSLAKRAHDFLDKKQVLLTQELESIRGMLLPLEQKLSNDAVKAYLLLSKALIKYGVHKVYAEAACVASNDEVEVHWTHARGVTVPRFKSLIKVRTPVQRGYDLIDGSCIIDEAASELEKCIELLVHVAELQSIAQRLEEEIRRARTLSLALEKILIPRIMLEIRRVLDYLEEQEREQHQRTKWVLKRTG